MGRGQLPPGRPTTAVTAMLALTVFLAMITGLEIIVNRWLRAALFGALFILWTAVLIVEWRSELARRHALRSH